MTATVPDARPPGRRERKKQRTREALVDAAFALFAEKGFDATTVEEIADAVDVSSRTFFRYFASKEEVALTFQDEQLRAVLATLAERPADEPIMTAIRRTVVQVARDCETGALGFSPERFECLITMTADSPALSAGSMEHTQRKLMLLTEVIAERMGLDPVTDLRPHIIAATAIGGFRTAAEALNAPEMGYPTLAEAADAAFAVLESDLNTR
ncbi:TetR family transcriptional regulator [Actinomadura algeriensis]|uniref:AcrR family transcriptional regulator n=1 Tax=Actinomadura algeriensis TaxID=1679523 RepID=A0ABR9JVG6_9ACTN|nr:TetR family transcriptional regulator [Actinomadura algeriensis]MBE1534561.1 AcrR family transcriptional regulator [Actinomadura algeriensis]